MAATQALVPKGRESFSCLLHLVGAVDSDAAVHRVYTTIRLSWPEVRVHNGDHACTCNSSPLPTGISIGETPVSSIAVATPRTGMLSSSVNSCVVGDPGRTMMTQVDNPHPNRVTAEVGLPGPAALVRKRHPTSTMQELFPACPSFGHYRETTRRLPHPGRLPQTVGIR